MPVRRSAGAHCALLEVTTNDGYARLCTGGLPCGCAIHRRGVVMLIEYGITQENSHRGQEARPEGSDER